MFIGYGLENRENLSAMDCMDKFTLESAKGGDGLAFLFSYLTAGKAGGHLRVVFHHFFQSCGSLIVERLVADAAAFGLIAGAVSAEQTEDGVQLRSG